MPTRSYPLLVIAGLALLTALGLFLRLDGVNEKSISHPEMYVPGIHLPPELSEPRERLTVARVLTGTFSSDTHPPGYYLVMLGWTKLFGTSLVSLRMPSILWGTACIPLIFWLAMLIAPDRPLSAWFAAALVAFSGYLAFWSQVARMFAMTTFLGLFATILLVKITRADRSSFLLHTLYAALMLAGLAGHLFFWTLLAAHLTWTIWDSRNRQGEMPAVFRTQILTFILGSPLIAFAAYQQGNTLAELSGDIPQFLRDFFSFAFIFPNEISGTYFGPIPRVIRDDAWMFLLRAAIFSGAAILLGLGIWTTRQTRESAPEPVAGAPLWTWIAATVAATSAIVLFVWMAKRFADPAPYPTLKYTQALIPLPAAILLTAIALKRWWNRLPSFNLSLFTGGAGLVAFLSVFPFALLGLLSLAKPVYNQRGLMFLAPYLLLVLSIGMARLAKTPVRTLALLVLLAPLYATSIAAYRPLQAGDVDYQNFSALLASHAHPGDLIFLRQRWDQTPILYYMPSSKYHFVVRDFDKAARQNPGARIWLIEINDEPAPDAAQPVLRAFQKTGKLTLAPAAAVLYQPAAQMVSQNSRNVAQ